jgi:hypothetical protein
MLAKEGYITLKCNEGAFFVLVATLAYIVKPKNRARTRPRRGLAGPFG